MAKNSLNQAISIVIPTLNEEGNIKKLVHRIDEALRQFDILYDLIFIDDHSTDNTRVIIHELATQYPISCYLKKGKVGKGYSIIEGFDHVTGELTATIDADLQYPPEVIPAMIEIIKSGKADFVIGDRDESQSNFIRKLFSKSFKLFFGRILHGFQGDVQSGLKVLRTKIIHEVTINPSPWAWDLELMINARNAGYKIDWVEILFAKRTSGESTVQIFKVAKELALNALKMKFKRKKLISIMPEGPNMIGAGVAKNGSRFITHSTLDSNISALKTFTFNQRLFIATIIGILGVGFYFHALMTGIVFMAILSAIYFFDALFDLYLVLKSLHNPPEINFTQQELDSIDDAELPIYTVMCPLFRESQVLPGFVKAISKVDWPKNKLDVMLLLEENDPECFRNGHIAPRIDKGIH